MKAAEPFVENAAEILTWAIDKGFKGSDPYDGLNSRLLAWPLEISGILRLFVIQTVKNSPVNLRSLLMVPDGLNPKGLALFLSGLGFDRDHHLPVQHDDLMDRLTQMILSLASLPDGSPAFSTSREIRHDITVEEVSEKESFGWGYNFPWQSRAFFQPRWFPTVVCSSFVLDAFRDSNSEFYPAVARAVARFSVNTLNIHRTNEGLCFSYSPRDNTRVYNASLFAAKIIASAAESIDTREKGLWQEMAAEACDFVAARQRSDGSWIYGEAPHWQWVDNLHTGFVLEAMQDISALLNCQDYLSVIASGLDYYRSNLFLEDGSAKYYNNSLYPLDPHCFAQGVITFHKLGDAGFAGKILLKAVESLWDSRRHGFIFRRYANRSNRQIHLRWAQGWMFKAICLAAWMMSRENL